MATSAYPKLFITDVDCGNNGVIKFIQAATGTEAGVVSLDSLCHVFAKVMECGRPFISRHQGTQKKVVGLEHGKKTTEIESRLASTVELPKHTPNT